MYQTLKDIEQNLEKAKAVKDYPRMGKLLSYWHKLNGRQGVEEIKSIDVKE